MSDTMTLRTKVVIDMSSSSCHTEANKSHPVQDNTCCGMKHTPRSPELKQNVARRINRIVGQLAGISAMVEDDRYCGDVLTQLAAVESAVKSVSRIVMQDHLETCVVDRIQDGDVEVVDEVMDLFKKFM